MVYAKIASLVFHLGGKHYELALFHPFLHALIEPRLFGQAPYAKALDDQGVVSLQEEVRHLPSGPRGQLQKSYFRVQGVVKPGGVGTLRADIAKQRAVPQDSQVGVVDAGKGLEALGPGLFRPRSGDDLVVKDDGDPRQVLRGTAEGVLEVNFGVRGVKADGLLGAGEDNGLGACLNEIAQRRRGVGHGVGTVGEDEAVVVVEMGPDGLGHHQPVSGQDVGGIQAQKLETVHGTNSRDGGDVGKELLRGQLRGKAALADLRGNGTAGTDE